MLTPQQILQQYWGYSAFRQPQLDIIQSVLQGSDTLALLPTGGGKSVCFQVPAMAMQGLCLVISPLIALMKDQVMNLEKKGIKAAAVYTGMSHRQIDTALDNCAYGNYKFLYISPERLATDDFKMRLVKMKVCLLAVDEAHCISQWGYDFRPPYLRIAEVRTQLPGIPIIALTATATPLVVEDIQSRLQFKQPNVFRKSFARTNLAYVVRPSMHKEQSLHEILSKVNGSAVVYVRNRRRTREIAEYLSSHKISADYYHAGLQPLERSQKQDAWVQNKKRVIVATNAFGMGIDKPDVRSVVHMDLPESLEAYFQEAGRAGRDEQKAYAVQLLDEADLYNLQKKSDEFPTVDFVKEVYDALGNYLQVTLNGGPGRDYSFDISHFSAQYKWKPGRVLAALKILQQQEQLYLTDGLLKQSAIKAVADKDVIYKFQQDNRALEPVVKFILRSSEGVFNDFVPLNEEAIAGRLKMPVEEVINQLNLLSRFSVFSYRQRSEQPAVIYLQPRVKKTDLRLDVKAIEQRRQDMEKRLVAVKNYVTENNICRTRLLVRYFGEQNDTDCGICDVCLQKKKATVSAAEFSEIAAALEGQLAAKEMPLSDLYQALHFKKEDVDKALDFLMDAGKVEKGIRGGFKWKR